MPCSASFTLRVVVDAVNCTVTFATSLREVQEGQPWSNVFTYTLGTPAETSWSAEGTKHVGGDAGAPATIAATVLHLSPGQVGGVPQSGTGNSGSVSGTAPQLPNDDATDYNVLLEIR